MIPFAPGLDLPEEVVTQTLGILAKRGAGKSNAGAVLAEGMYDAGLQFVVIDPVGAWWGLRSSEDGKAEGLSIPIFGGHRGDVPLDYAKGALVADLVVSQGFSCVLDVSDFDSEEQKKRFLADFAERLFRLKGTPGHDHPLHLFLEEADDYIPQQGSKSGSSGRCLGAFERIVKRGRARGIGATMISQRSASLNKDVLTQIETLVVLKTVGPADRKAIADWLKYHGQGEEILSSLAKLEPGEAWVWSMWLDYTDRHRIYRRRTFDSGATPGIRKRQAPAATLAEVDIASITEQMQETIDKAREADPAHLRRQLADLRKQLAAKPVPVSPEPRVIEVPVLTPDEEATLALLDGHLSKVQKRVDELAEDLRQIAKGIEKRLGVGEREAVKAVQAVRRRPMAASNAAPATRREGTTGPEQKALDALAWFEAVGITPATRQQVAMVAGYHPRSKGFINALGSLSTSGRIDYPASGQVALTVDGRVEANFPEATPTTEALHATVLSTIKGPQARILAEVLAVYPESITRDELADRLDYHPRSKGFINPLGSLRTLGLIGYPERGRVKAEPILFVEAA